MSTQGLVMFSTSQCPGCVQAAAWMRQNGVPFTEVKVDGNLELINRLAQRTGQRTVPQFFLNDSHLVGGFADVQQLRSKGQI